MKKIVTFLLIGVAVFVIAFTVFVDLFVDQDKLSNAQEPIYVRTESLMDDIGNSGHKFIYEEYFSSNVQDEYMETEWKKVHEQITDNDLVSLETSYSLIKESLSLEKSLIGKSPERYKIEVDLSMGTNKNDPQATLMWVKENEDFKLRYMEFPIEEQNNGIQYVTFGIQ